jgi:hypothetical protein
MNIFPKMLVCVLAGALIAGCGSAPYRSGKGSDHEVTYRPINEQQQKMTQREVVYVERPYVYYQPVPAYRVVPVQPGYRVVTSQPAYNTVTSRPAYQPTYTIVPVTRYYYVE